MLGRRFHKVDYRRMNNDQIELTTNNDLGVSLERIYGMESRFSGENPGVNNEKGEFSGWIEVNPLPKLDKKDLKDAPIKNAPIKIIIKSNKGEITKYTECILVNRPIPAEEKTQNDAFCLKGTIS